jgi:hypothetical protein
MFPTEPMFLLAIVVLMSATHFNLFQPYRSIQLVTRVTVFRPSTTVKLKAHSMLDSPVAQRDGGPTSYGLLTSIELAKPVLFAVHEIVRTRSWRTE